MEQLDFNRLEQAFDKCCVKATENIPELQRNAKELLVFAEHHVNRPLVIQNLKRELLVHYSKRKAYKSPARFKQNAQLIILTVAEMFMLAIKKKRDQDNLSEVERIRLSQGDQLKNDLSKILVEVPNHGETPKAD